MVPPAVTDPTAPSTETRNFIRDIIDEDLATGRHGQRVVTRFPPEPNGYLHIGHAKSIVLNFGIKRDYADQADTRCHLRFDDTNPETESVEYVESIKEAVHWLGYDWGNHLFHAADYFEQFYDYAVVLIEKGLAYVDSLNAEQISEYRGTVNEPGRPSPYRDRSVEENLDLFRRMREGEFADGEHVLRAKIDMASPHMILRDPVLFRIKHAHHYRRGDEWCIYPMYDFAHPLEDAIENITHSLCTLEFDNNRRVYDWVLENALDAEAASDRPHQYEFSRLNITYTVMSKRKLLQLVEEGEVAGWDDPRLPTIFGMRRRGITPEAIVSFCEDVGVTRTESRVEIAQLEHAIRDDLNEKAPRVMAVLDPLKVVVTNMDEDTTEQLDAPHWPRDIDKEESRPVPFTRELYIERDDFREDPPAGFYRLAPGREVRLRSGYFFTCEEVVRDDHGEIAEIRGMIDPDTRDGTAPDGRSPKGTIHWVSAEHGVPFEARIYDRLFDVPAPDEGDEDFHEHLNDQSLVVRTGFVEPTIRDFDADQRFQFERNGYFWQDPEDSAPDALVFNQIVSLRDAWADDDDVDLEQKRKEKEEIKRRNRERSIANKKDHAETLDQHEMVRFVRFRDELEISPDDAAILAGREDLATFFTEVVDAGASPQLAANWIVNELMGQLKDTSTSDLRFDAEAFASLLDLVDAEEVSSSGGRTVLDVLLEEGGNPSAIVDDRGLRQIDDTSKLRSVVRSVLADHPDETERYRSGKKGLIGFFMGQIMKETGGSANPETARALAQEELENG